MRTFGLLLFLALAGVCFGAEQKPASPPQSKEPTYDGRTLSEWVAVAKQQSPAMRWATWEKMTPAAVPALTELLKHTDRQVRVYAVSALEHIGSKAKSAIPDLMELLKDKDADVRQAVAKSLGAIDPEAKTVVPMLTELLKDNHWYVRWTAAWTLRKMGPKAKAAMPALTQSLQDTNVRVREAAAKALESISGSGAKAAARHFGDLVGDETEYQAWHAKLTEDRWESLLRKAGKPDAGVVLEARLVPESPAPGTRIQLVFSLRNVSDCPFQPGWASIRPFESLVEPKLLIRNSKGEPVELTRKGMREVYETMFGGGSGRFPRLEPGYAWGGDMTVSDYFDLSKPGDYTILAWGGKVSEDSMMVGMGGAFRRNVGLRGWVTKPLTLKIGKQPVSSDDKRRPDLTQPAKSSQTPPSDPAEKEWAELLVDAGRLRENCILDATPSPLAPKAVHLVVSLIDLDVGGREIYMGRNPANYRILIRDAAGGFVPLTDFGREVYASRGKESLSYIYVGDAHGAIFPLDEMFAIKAGQDYTVLVSLPPEKSIDFGWVAPPVRIHVPELEVPGVTRPHYGSEKMWAKLIAIASTQRGDLNLDNSIQHGYAAYLQMQLKDQSHTASYGDWRLADKTILIRDSRGKAVLPSNKGMPHDSVELWCQAPWEIRLPEQITAAENGKTLPEVKEAWYPLTDAYTLRSGCRYTIISALNLSGNVKSLIVSKPVTFAMPIPCVPYDDPRTKKGASDIPAKASQPTEPDFDLRWKEALRFAGKPFDGLALRATVDKPTQVKIVLCNISKNPILVKKWKGESDYDLLVRGPSGNPVAMTEKGKNFFQSSRLLDIRKLTENGTIEASLPIRELFDMRAPGEYTVLASVPVVGDVDAVLTATPVKMQVQ